MARKNVGRTKASGKRGGKWKRPLKKTRATPSKRIAKSKRPATKKTKRSATSTRKRSASKAVATKAARAALKRAEAEIRKLKAKGKTAKKLAASHAAQVKKLKASLKSAVKKGTKAQRDRVTRSAKGVATRAAHAATVTPDRSTRLAEAKEYVGPEIPLPPRAFPEGRLFRSGGAVLGYFEGRPGILQIRSVTPLLPPVGVTHEPPPRLPTPDVTARIDAIVDDWATGDVDDEGEVDRGNLPELLWEAYWDAEEFGALVEADIDSDSGGDT